MGTARMNLCQTAYLFPRARWSGWRALPVAALALAAAGMGAPAQAEELVRFSVKEAAGVSGPRHVTGGVPLNRDVLPAGDLSSLRLLDEKGRPIDFEATVTARWSWPEGSVQWLLLDFAADFQAHQTRRLTLTRTQGALAARASVVHVKESDDAIEVTNGAITFAVSKQQFGLLGGVVRNGTPVTAASGGDLIVDMLQAVPTETDEENWLRPAPAQGPIARLSARAGKEYRAEVEFQNGKRAVIKLSGKLGLAPDSEGRTDAVFPYAIRLTVVANDAEVRIRPTLLYDGDVHKETIRRIGLSLPLAGSADRLTAAAGGQGADPLAGEPEAPPRPAAPSSPDDVRLDLPAGAKLSLLSVGPEKRFHAAPRYAMARIAYTIDRISNQGHTQTLGVGDSSRGWIAGSDGRRTIYAVVRDFWRLHPKELSVDAASRTVNIWLWPDRGDVVLDARRHSEQKAYEALRPGEGWRYEGATQDIGYFFGRALSHELAVRFEDRPLDSPLASRLAAAANEPLYVLCDPEYYSRSQVIGPIAPYNPERFPRLEGAQEVFLEWWMRNQRNYGWYGLIDYGDVLMEFDWFHMRKWGERREGWMARGYSGWLNNDGQVDHTLYLHALRRGDRALMKFAEAMTRHTGEIDTPHLEMPRTGKRGVGINDNHGRPRVGGAARHNGQHWGDYVMARGTATLGLTLLYGMTGDLRLLDIMRSVAQFHYHHDSYANDDGLGGLARFYHFLGDEALLKRARALRPQYARMSPNFTYFNNRLITLWHYGVTTGDESVREQLVANSEQLRAEWARGVNYNEYAQGLTEAFAFHLTGDARHLDQIHQPLLWIGRKNYANVNLSTTMQGGASRLPFSQLWARVRGFNPITPQKAYHIHGIVLQKFPFLLSVLKDESFLDEE